MTGSGEDPPYFEYVVGEEKRLRDLVSGEEAGPLLRMALLGGASEAFVADGSGTPLWQESGGVGNGSPEAKRVIRIEGEPAGTVVVRGSPDAGPLSEAVGGAIEAIASGNLKRMLTTETHTAVVNRSFDELLEINRRLSVSEAAYRALSESLEVKVAERTDELKRAYAHLLQQEKLASVGRLAAGIAHEINNPMGFVASNVNTLSRYVARFAEMLAFQREAIVREGSGAIRDEMQKLWESGRLDSILADVAPLFAQTREGAARVQKIVSDLRGFSHIDDDGIKATDLNEEIERTLSVLAHEIPSDAQVEKDFGPLPPFRCNAAHFCQTFLNLVRNAIQARPEGLVLRIRSRAEGNRITIAFSDNGSGIPADDLPHVFEPFFTTREIGQGMGMGLTVARDVVTAHGGTIEAENAQGSGALFTITLDSGKG